MSTPARETFTPSDYGHLLAGQVYATAEPYVDFDGVAHPRGETWTFLGHHFFPYDDGLTLHVRGPSGERRQIRLQQRPETQGAIVEALPYYLERLTELPAEHALQCACESAHWTVAAELAALGPDVPSGLREAVREPGLEVLVCTTCGIMVAVEARPGGHAMLALDAHRRRELERAITLDPQGPLGEVIDAALACTSHPANLIVALKLSERPSFVTEVAGRLSSPRAEERIPALDLVSRMRPTPPVLADGVARALTHPLPGDVVSDERLRVLMALYPLAAEAHGFRAEVAALLEAVGSREGELADLLRKVALALLARMDAAREDARIRRERAAEELAELILDGEDQAAEKRALALEPDERHANGVPGRAQLWEDAGDVLAKHHGDAAVKAWTRALALWSMYSASPSNEAEGPARTADVERVAMKLARHPRG